MTETLKPISHPASLKAGAVVVRIRKAGEECNTRYRVVGWATPPVPAAGQAWGSGFLHLVSENAGAKLSVGPAKVVCREFRQVVAVRDRARSGGRESARRYWWQDGD